MLETFDDASAWEAVQQVTVPVDETTTFKQGGSAIKFDKDGGGDTDGIIIRKLAVPMAIQTLFQRGELISFWVNLSTVVDVASVSLELIYDAGASGTAFTKLDRFTNSSLSAGWNQLTPVSLAAGTAIGSPGLEDRRRLLALAIRITMNAAGDTLTNIIVDAATITGTSLLTFSGNRLLVPRFDKFDVNFVDQSIVNRAERASEVVFITTLLRIAAGWKRGNEILKAGFGAAGLHEGLRRFSNWVKANKSWALAKNSTLIASTTVDATSGFGQSDPRVLNITSTADTEFLITDLGETDLEFLVGPNDFGQYERGIVKDISYVATGVSITFQNALAYVYENEDRVRTLNFFPELSIMAAGSPMTESERGWLFNLIGEEF